MLSGLFLYHAFLSTVNHALVIPQISGSRKVLRMNQIETIFHSHIRSNRLPNCSAKA